MKKTTGKKPYQIVNKFQSLIREKPSARQMFEEVRMMKFKIRPIQGDLSGVDLRNERFIETIWSLGKLDEFFREEFDKLSPANKKVFTEIFDKLYFQYQEELNKINIFKKNLGRKQKILEMEIYKDAGKKKIN